MLRVALHAACIIANLTAKWYSFVFLRLLPLGYRYLSTIFTASAIYLVSFIALRHGGNDSRKSISGAFLALLLGLPGRRFSVASLIGLAATLVAPLFCLDFLYRAHYLYPAFDVGFARTGWVGSTSASLLLRTTEQVNLTYWADGIAPIEVTLLAAELTTDLTIPVHLENLRARTAYQYSTTNELGGSFHTRDEHLSSFSLLSTSCQKPGWPYNPIQHPLAIPGLSHMDSVIRTMTTKPEVVLFLGDFISNYTAEYFRKLYRQTYASPSWTPLLRSVPWVHMFDDHEIVNDFAPSSEDLQLFEDAMDPFRNYQQSVNPPSRTTYFSFNIGQVAFYVFDNRSFRSPQPERPSANSTAGFGTQTMLGVEQNQHFKRWVEQEKDVRLLVVVSGTPMTRNWSEGGDELDSWAGYLDEREEILSLLWDAGGAIVISGDRHEHATTLLPPPVNSPYPYTSAVIEFSTSPLSFFHQPWAREYKAHPPTDIPIYTHWDGMSKFGIFEFDTSNGGYRLMFKLVVDGEITWEYHWAKGRAVHIEH